MEIYTSKYTASELTSRMEEFILNHKSLYRNLKFVIAQEFQLVGIIIFELILLTITSLSSFSETIGKQRLGFFWTLMVLATAIVFGYIEYKKRHLFGSDRGFHRAKEEYHAFHLTVERFNELIQMKELIESIEENVHKLNEAERKIIYNATVSQLQAAVENGDEGVKMVEWTRDGCFRFDILDEQIRVLLTEVRQ